MTRTILIVAALAASMPIVAASAQRPTADEFGSEQQTTAALNGKVIADLTAQRTNAAAAEAQYKGAVAANRTVALDLKRLENETDDAYAVRVAAWRAQVAACEGGDRAACVPD